MISSLFVQVGEELLEISGSISKEEDVFRIFGEFCEGKISSLPWVPDRLSPGFFHSFSPTCDILSSVLQELFVLVLFFLHFLF